MVSLPPLQRVPLIGLGAAIPVVVYLVTKGQPFVAAALLNVALITGGLYYMFSPAEGDPAGDASDGTGTAGA